MPASDSIAYKFRPGLQAATLDDKKVPTDHTASIFRDRALYFNSISGFNDPFESKFICPEKPENDAHAFRSILNRIISAIGGSAAEVNLFLANPLARWFMFELASRDYEQASIIIELEHLYRNYLYQIGTLCLNQGFDDILSWSHYANNHTGIAIGFDVNELYQSKENYFPIPKGGDSGTSNTGTPKHGIFVAETPISITYVSDQIPIDIMSYTPNDFARLSLSTKSLHWGYEREVRYLAIPRRKSISYGNVLNIIRAPFLEHVDNLAECRVYRSTTWGVEDGKMVNFMDLQDQALLDALKSCFHPPNRYPLRHVYSQITSLMMPPDSVSNISIEFKHPTALKEVIFGSQARREDVLRQARWIKKLGHYDHVKFYQMLASTSRFAIQRMDV
ncbi:MAG TPA: DUF2971 domain-containing protein [Marinobacter sp.]|uniref:DUF2971 domain-containing protein n=1 Tax=marine sediment metagenome TaxID=412755 RepID=A0A0F9TD40_9ZZZZ|nr:DUF2971 domain-containing protein [Marinobacter sp.]